MTAAHICHVGPLQPFSVYASHPHLFPHTLPSLKLLLLIPLGVSLTPWRDPPDTEPNTGSGAPRTFFTSTKLGPGSFRPETPPPIG